MLAGYGLSEKSLYKEMYKPLRDKQYFPSLRQNTVPQLAFQFKSALAAATK